MEKLLDSFKCFLGLHDDNVELSGRESDGVASRPTSRLLCQRCLWTSPTIVGDWFIPDRRTREPLKLKRMG